VTCNINADVVTCVLHFKEPGIWREKEKHPAPPPPISKCMAELFIISLCWGHFSVCKRQMNTNLEHLSATILERGMELEALDSQAWVSNPGHLTYCVNSKASTSISLSVEWEWQWYRSYQAIRKLSWVINLPRCVWALLWKSEFLILDIYYYYQ
jgi:hypothetical protein